MFDEFLLEDDTLFLFDDDHATQHQFNVAQVSTSEEQYSRIALQPSPMFPVREFFQRRQYTEEVPPRVCHKNWEENVIACLKQESADQEQHKGIEEQAFRIKNNKKRGLQDIQSPEVLRSFDSGCCSSATPWLPSSCTPPIYSSQHPQTQYVTSVATIDKYSYQGSNMCGTFEEITPPHKGSWASSSCTSGYLHSTKPVFDSWSKKHMPMAATHQAHKNIHKRSSFEKLNACDTEGTNNLSNLAKITGAGQQQYTGNWFKVVDSSLHSNQLQQSILHEGVGNLASEVNLIPQNKSVAIEKLFTEDLGGLSQGTPKRFKALVVESEAFMFTPQEAAPNVSSYRVTACEVQHSSSFKETYLRNPRKRSVKNLQCFPYCSVPFQGSSSTGSSDTPNSATFGQPQTKKAKLSHDSTTSPTVHVSGRSCTAPLQILCRLEQLDIGSQRDQDFEKGNWSAFAFFRKFDTKEVDGTKQSVNVAGICPISNLFQVGQTANKSQFNKHTHSRKNLLGTIYTSHVEVCERPPSLLGSASVHQNSTNLGFSFEPSTWQYSWVPNSQSTIRLQQIATDPVNPSLNVAESKDLLQKHCVRIGIFERMNSDVEQRKRVGQRGGGGPNDETMLICRAVVDSPSFCLRSTRQKKG